MSKIKVYGIAHVDWWTDFDGKKHIKEKMLIHRYTDGHYGYDTYEEAKANLWDWDRSNEQGTECWVQEVMVDTETGQPEGYH